MTTLPPRLRDEGATDLEQLMLTSAARERPTAELSEKMLAGLSAAAALGASSSAAAATSTSLKTSVLLKWALGGVAALGMGAVALSFTGQEPRGSQARATQVETKDARAEPLALPPPESPVKGERAEVSTVSQPPGAPAPAGEASPEKTSSPATASLRAGSDRPTLSEELLLLDQVRTALSESRLDRATRLLGVYKSRYQNGVLRQEATMLEVKVRRAQGDIKAAAALEADFAKRHPESAHRSQDLAPLEPAPSE